MWLEDHYEDKRLDLFDYVIIDCHPDFSTATAMQLQLVTQLLVRSFQANTAIMQKFNLEDRLESFRQEVINYRTRRATSLLSCTFIPNMIKHRYQFL